MATLPQVQLDAADALADWCSISAETFGSVYSTELTGTDALPWKVLTVMPGNLPSTPECRKALFRAAAREALRLDLLMHLALRLTRTETDVAGRTQAEVNAIIATLEAALQGTGRMQALVQQGGLLGREAQLGLRALDAASALVRRNDDPIGTAFLVAPDLVLTSAHVVVHQSPSEFVPELKSDLSFHFPVYAGSERTDTIVAKAEKGKKGLVHSSLPWGRPPDTLHGPPDTGSATKLDYALIRLDRQINHADPLNILEPPELQRNDPLVVLGFAGGTAVKWNTGHVDLVTGERLEHKVNTLAGMSGSCCIDGHGKPVGMHEGSLARKFHQYRVGSLVAEPVVIGI